MAAIRRRILPSICLVATLSLGACGGGGGGGGGGGPVGDANPPELRILSFQSDEVAVQSSRITVAWLANDADDEATVSIFADRDGDLGTVGDRFTLVDEVIDADGQPQEAEVELGALRSGSYRVLGRIRDGKGAELIVPASGRLVVENRVLIAPLGGESIEIRAHLPRADGSFDVIGQFEGLVNFDPRNRVQSTGRTIDAFVAHYSRRGVIQWLTVFESSGAVAANAFVRDANGDLLICGSFGGSLQLPTGTTVRGRADDVFIARVSASGATLWVRTASSLNRDYATDIALLADGSFAVVGTFNVGNTTYPLEFGLDPTGRPLTVPSAGRADAFIAHFDAAGKPLWASGAGGAADDDGLALAVLAGDRIVVGGAFRGSASFGDGSQQRSAQGGADGFLAEWDRKGRLQSVDTVVGDGAERIVDLARCGNGDLALLANSDSATLDVVGRASLTLAAGRDVALARVAADGSVRWALGEVVGAGDSTGMGLSPLPDDSLLVTGSFAAGARFGRSGRTPIVRGPVDGFVSSRDADGEQVWLRSFSSAAVETDLAVSAGADGTILVTGDRGSADLEVVSQQGSVTLPGTGAGSDFVARLHPGGGLGAPEELPGRVAGTGSIRRGGIEVTVGGLVATWQGFDDVETTPAVRQLLDEHPQVGLLVVQSANGPGRGSAHLDGARRLAAAGVETHIPFNGGIYGGGVDLFLGGRRRTAGVGAVIGVRSWIDENRLEGHAIRGDRGNPAHVPYLEFYDALGVPRDYYWFSIETPRGSFLRLSRAQFEQYQIVTE